LDACPAGASGPSAGLHVTAIGQLVAHVSLRRHCNPPAIPEWPASESDYFSGPRPWWPRMAFSSVIAGG
jgi:hypothetical protein